MRGRSSVHRCQIRVSRKAMWLPTRWSLGEVAKAQVVIELLNHAEPPRLKLTNISILFGSVAGD